MDLPILFPCENLEIVIFKHENEAVTLISDLASLILPNYVGVGTEYTIVCCLYDHQSWSLILDTFDEASVIK